MLLVFGCPGSLIGIGREQSSVVNVQPQAAAWTKDPLHDISHVFLASGGQSVHEYSSWNDFISGNNINHFNLPTTMALGNFVVYDRDLYYVKVRNFLL